MPLSARRMTPSALKVSNLRVQFGAHVAVADASFEVSPGETLGLVGESGSGKSSLARAILRLLPAAGGTVEWRGRNLLDSSRAEMRALRRELQIVFQDPLASLDPRMSIGATVGEPLEIFEPDLSRMQRRLRVQSMLERVGLAADMYARYPHEFSGGQCQRVGIARAMILNPALLICDEPVSSLDVSIQGQIVNLLLDIRRDSGMSVLFISHNLAIVRHVSHRVLVLFKGELVETAACADLFSAPAHPYTIELLRAATGTTGSDTAASTSIAAPAWAGSAAATGCCVFRDRCAYVLPLCRTVAPPLVELAPDHRAACHRAREIAVSDILRT